MHVSCDQAFLLTDQKTTERYFAFSNLPARQNKILAIEGVHASPCDKSNDNLNIQGFSIILVCVSTSVFLHAHACVCICACVCVCYNDFKADHPTMAYLVGHIPRESAMGTTTVMSSVTTF